MKNDAQLTAYLELADWDEARAFQVACADHHPMDQTLDMKRSQMGAMIEKKNRLPAAEGEE